MSDATVVLRCSFCDKSQHEVAKLVAGTKAFICNECTTLCSEIVAGPLPDLSTRSVSRYEIAQLRLSAFIALNGWGSKGEDGQWKTWDWGALEDRAAILVEWALRVPSADAMLPADLYGEAQP